MTLCHHITHHSKTSAKKKENQAFQKNRNVFVTVTKYALIFAAVTNTRHAISPSRLFNGKSMFSIQTMLRFFIHFTLIQHCYFSFVVASFHIVRDRRSTISFLPQHFYLNQNTSFLHPRTTPTSLK